MAGQVSAGHRRTLANERNLWVLGTSDEVGRQVAAYQAVGVTHLIFAVPLPFDLAPLQLFAREVIPLFR